MQKQSEAETKVEMEQRKETLKQLQEHIEQYRIDNIRDEVRDQIEETKENTQYLASRNYKQISDVIALMEEMTVHHDDSNSQLQKDIIEACFEQYSDYLGELEKKDVRSLKKRLGELKGMQKNLTRDLQDSDREKMGLLRERETLLVANNNPLAKRNEDRLRIRCQAKMDEVDNTKKWILSDRERLVEIAAEMKEGNEKLFNSNKSDILQNHDRLKAGQDEKLALSQRLAFVKQEVRNHQLKNMVLEETIDEQFDKQCLIK